MKTMKFNPLLVLTTAAALSLLACGKTPEQKAADATGDRLEAEAKEVKATAAATAEVVKKDAVIEAAATKKQTDATAAKLEKTAEQVKASPSPAP